MDYFFLILSLGLLTFAIGPVTSSNKGCLKLSKCSAELGAAAKENQLDELCRAIKKAMDCFDAAKDGCQNEKFRKSFNSTFEKSKALYAKRCGQKDDSGRDAATRSTAISAICLLVCLALGQLGLRHTSG